MQTFSPLIGGDMQFFGGFSLSFHLVALLILVGAASVVDVYQRRIPNYLIALGTLFGILYHMSAPDGSGIGFALAGLGIGIVTLFPIYALGLMGAGDVKLMGMIGSFLGITGVFGVILASMASGGILALGLAASKRMLPQLLVNLHLMMLYRGIKKADGTVATTPTAPSIGNMPYALAILAGTLIQLFVLRY